MTEKSNEQGLEELIAGFSSNDKKIRLNSIWYAYRLKGNKNLLLPTLLKILEEDEDFEVRARAADALGRLEYKEAVEPLMKSVYSTNTDLRINALFALRILEDERALPILLDTIKDKDGRVREYAVDAMGKLRNEQVFQILLDVLINDPVIDVRACAAENLGEFGDKRAIEPLLTVLREKPDDGEESNRGVRDVAALALGRFKEERLFEPIFALLSDPDDFVRPDAIDALGELGDRRALEPLLAILNDKSQPFLLRLRAAEAIGGLNNCDERVVKALVDVLDEEKEDWNTQTVGKAAAYSLGRLGEPGLLALMEAAKSSNNDRRNNAITVLISSMFNYYKDSRVVEILKEIVRDKTNLDLWVTYALKKIGIE